MKNDNMTNVFSRAIHSAREWNWFIGTENMTRIERERRSNAVMQIVPLLVGAMWIAFTLWLMPAPVSYVLSFGVAVFASLMTLEFYESNK